MKDLRISIYRFKTLLQSILYLRSNFTNWIEIIRRAIDGKSTPVLYIRNGYKLRGVDNNTLSIFKEIYINKVYNPIGFEFSNGDTIIDIGANVGVFSLYSSTVRDSKVYSFEPHPKNYSILSSNIKENDIRNIESFKCAIGDKNESRYLIEGEIPGGHILGSDGNLNPQKEELKTNVIRLDDFLKENNISVVNFLKIDCEGSEGEILSSLNASTFAIIKKVVIEFHDNYSRLNHDEIMSLLTKHGFTSKLDWDGISYFGYIYAFNNNN